MKIKDIYNDINSDIEVKDIKINSKEVTDGDIFICTTGVTADRHDFVNEAVKNGAKLIIASKPVNVDVDVKYVENTNKELIPLARKLYDFHDEELSLIGTTGTNGKTTVALMIKYLLGDKCGYIGTNGIIANSFNEHIRNTTPDADRLYKYFKRFINDNCNILSMETSSEAFFRNRLDTLEFDVSILTNITEDHLNIHKTLENYVDCKMDLFRKTKKDGYCILNIDDLYFDLASKNSNGKVLSYGKKESDLQIIDYKLYYNKTNITLKYKNDLYSFETQFVGDVNVYNICAALLACISYGRDINDLIDRIKLIPKIDGRLDFIEKNTNYKIVLDYAHTLDSFKKILPFLNEIKENRLIIITGAAGGRQVEKRAPIGKYILDNSDLVIFTMDDPRNENVDDIINDLVSDTDKDNYIRISNREDAIKYAFDNAEENDIILVAGKGTDNYMAIGNDYLPYSDIDVINKYFDK